MRIAMSVEIPGWVIFDDVTDEVERFYVEGMDASQVAVRTDRHGNPDAFIVDENGRTFVGDGITLDSKQVAHIVEADYPALEVL